MWSPSRVPATSPSQLITIAYAHSRVFLMASPERWPNTGTFGSMVLGCTDVCGTATLEGEKILSGIIFPSGHRATVAASERAQLKRDGRPINCGSNFNHDSGLRCAFRAPASG